jgi:hypothetical protein
MAAKKFERRRLSIDFPTEEAMATFFADSIEPWAKAILGREVSIFKRDALDSKSITPKYEYIVKARSGPEGDRPYGEYRVVETLVKLDNAT